MQLMPHHGQIELDRFASRLMRRGRIPGLSLGISKHGRPVVARGYGYRDRERGLPATTATIYGIASMTKSFTALAILQLEENRRLRVTDPVVRLLPEFRTTSPRWTRKIALHHFLNHSSGLPPLPSIYYASGRSLARDPPYDPRVARRVGIDPAHVPLDTYEQVMEFLATEPYRLLGPPGRFFSYSNEAFGLLGAVIERASGRSYESYIEEEILRPAGMTHSTFDTGIMFRFPEVTTLYSPRRTGSRPRLVPSQDWWEDTSLRACGALRTNIDDLFSYLEIYRTGGRVGRERILSTASLRKMLRPTISISPGLYYGYGIAVRPDYHGSLLAFHNGGLKGVSSEFAVLPARGIGGAVLANVEGAPSPALLGAGINQQLGLPLRTPFVDTPVPSEPRGSLREYAGWYCSGEGIWVQVTALRTHLRLDFRGIELTATGITVRPAGDERFVGRVRGTPVSIRFVRDPRGRIWAAFLGWRLVRRRRPLDLPKASKGGMTW
jgi:CubicO group peptidase (beta-lactamase class C family)